MKEFIVNSAILPGEIDPVACAMGIPKMLRDAGVKDIHVKTCYCCDAEGKVVFEFEASNKESLSKALRKIDLPVESIMETKKVMPETGLLSFKCRDIGMKCDFGATAKTQDELMKKIAEHARKAHNMKTIPPDVMEKVKKAIKK